MSIVRSHPSMTGLSLSLALNLALLLSQLSLSGFERQPGEVVEQQPASQPDRIANDIQIPVLQWNGGPGRVRDLFLSPLDNRLLIAIVPPRERVADNLIHDELVVLDIASARELDRFQADFIPMGKPAPLAFSPDGKCLAVLSAKELALRDLETHQVKWRVSRKDSEREISDLGLAADGTVLVGGADFLNPEKAMLAWNLATGEPLPTPGEGVIWEGHHLSRDGSMFWSGGWPGPTPRICKTDRTNQITYCFRSKWPLDAAFAPDGERFFSIHEDGIFVVWEIKETGQNARQLASAVGFDGATAIAVSHDMKWFAIGTENGEVRIHAMPTELQHVEPDDD